MGESKFTALAARFDGRRRKIAYRLAAMLERRPSSTGLALLQMFALLDVAADMASASPEPLGEDEFANFARLSFARRALQRPHEPALSEYERMVIDDLAAWMRQRGEDEDG